MARRGHRRSVDPVNGPLNKEAHAMVNELARRPFADLADVRGRLDRFFDELTGGRHEDGAWSMAIDVKRKDGTLAITADAPGFEPGEIKVAIEDGVLTVSAEHEESSEEEREGYVRRERRYGSFRRSIVLPPEAEVDKIEAHTRNGVVEITVPVGAKAPERIEITPSAD
jgi:HSP20 family protein